MAGDDTTFEFIFKDGGTTPVAAQSVPGGSAQKWAQQVNPKPPPPPATAQGAAQAVGRSTTATATKTAIDLLPERLLGALTKMGGQAVSGAVSGAVGGAVGSTLGGAAAGALSLAGGPVGMAIGAIVAGAGVLKGAFDGLAKTVAEATERIRPFSAAIMASDVTNQVKDIEFAIRQAERNGQRLAALQDSARQAEREGQRITDALDNLYAPLFQMAEDFRVWGRGGIADLLEGLIWVRDTCTKGFETLTGEQKKTNKELREANDKQEKPGDELWRQFLELRPQGMQLPDGLGRFGR